MTKEQIFSNPNFDVLELYLEEMFPNRYEFQDTQLLLYYPEVTVKDTAGNTYTIYDIFIHLEYDYTAFRFTKLTYTLADYANTRGLIFAHPHANHNSNYYFTGDYCKGTMDIFHYFDNLPSVVKAINNIDFWLHNENSSDCYITIKELIEINHINSLSAANFKFEIRYKLIELVNDSLELTDTIFGKMFSLKTDREKLKSIFINNLRSVSYKVSTNLLNFMNNCGNYTINFKEKTHYIKIQAFDGEYLLGEASKQLKDDVLQQFETFATAEFNDPYFSSGLEDYYFKNIRQTN